MSIAMQSAVWCVWIAVLHITGAYLTKQVRACRILNCRFYYKQYLPFLQVCFEYLPYVLFLLASALLPATIARAIYEPSKSPPIGLYRREVIVSENLLFVCGRTLQNLVHNFMYYSAWMRGIIPLLLISPK